MLLWSPLGIAFLASISNLMMIHRRKLRDVIVFTVDSGRYCKAISGYQTVSPPPPHPS